MEDLSFQNPSSLPNQSGFSNAISVTNSTQPLIPSPAILEPTLNSGYNLSMENLSVQNTYPLLQTRSMSMTNTQPLISNPPTFMNSYTFTSNMTTVSNVPPPPPPPAFNQNFDDFLPVNGNQEGPTFELLESDLPFLESFLNDPPNPINQDQPKEEGSSGGVQIISQSPPSEFDNSLNDHDNNPVLNSMGLSPSQQNLVDTLSQAALAVLKKKSMVRFHCLECKNVFHSIQALNGHKSYHAKMKKMEAEELLAANQGETSSAAAARGQQEPPVDDQEDPEEPALKIRRIQEN